MFASLSFPGGHQGLSSFISKNLVYPEIAMENGIEGIVLAKASFDEAGRLIKVTIERSLMKECDEAVLGVLNKMPQWYPAILNGKAIPKTLLLPVSFKL
jgi:protein TonB